MLVGEGPGPLEDQTGIPFHPDAPSGELITKILKELGVSRKEVYITNATRCSKGFDGDGQEITDKQIRTCKKYLVDEIEKINPKYIVLAGNAALKAALGHRGITKENGALRLGPDGRMYMPILHPASALPDRFPENREKIKGALRDLIGLIRNEGKDPLAGVTINIIDSWHGFVQLKALLEQLAKDDERALVCVDLETNMLDNAFKKPNARVGGVAFAWNGTEGWYLPIHHENPVVWNDQDLAEITQFLKWFSKTKFRKANQNIKFDYEHWLASFHVPLTNISGDAMLASDVIDQNVSHALDKTAWLVGLGGYDQALEKWFQDNKVKERVYTRVPLEILGKYGVGDAVCTYRAEIYFREKMRKRGQLDLYYKHITPGIAPYAQMECKGMLIDTEYVEALDKYYDRKIIEHTLQLREIAGTYRLAEVLDSFANKKKKTLEQFNFDSPEQVGRLLAKWLNLLPIVERIRAREDKKREDRALGRRGWEDNSGLKAAEINPLRVIEITKTGRVSTNKNTLKAILGNTRDFKLADKQREWISLYLSFKGIKKRKSTSIKGILKFLCPDDRVRTIYNLDGAATGRRSSKEPNLQNIPKDRIIKRIFIAPPKHLLLMFDYKNLEARIAAYMSGDERLIDAFNSGKDVHSYTASVVFQKDYDAMMKILDTPYDVVKEDQELNERYIEYSTYRAQAKLVMWTILFGGGAEKISNLTGVTMGEAERTLDSMLDEFDGLRQMFVRFEKFAVKHGYAKTDFNRRRYLLGIHSYNKKVSSKAIRESLNSPVQGTAAGITYEALTKTYRALRKNRLRAWPIQEVHDAITVEVHYKDAHKAALISLEAMESVSTVKSKGKITFEADASIGKHLGSKTKLDKALLEQLSTDPWSVYKLCMKDMSLNPATYEPRKGEPQEIELEEEDDSLLV